MRIMHFNVFEGAGERQHAIAAIVRTVSPDVLGVLEANGWQEGDTLTVLANETALPYTDLAVAPTGFHLATLTAHPPIRFIREQEGFHHAVSGAVVAHKTCGEIAVLFYHANPFSEDVRVQEITRLAELVRTFPSAVVMGDFNALSPHDPYDADFLVQLRNAGIKKFGDAQLRFDAVTVWEAAGMVDVAQLLHIPFTTTAPTPWNRDHMHTVPVRLDYAFVTENLVAHVHSVTVLKNDDTDQASDHYPLVLELA